MGRQTVRLRYLLFANEHLTFVLNKTLITHGILGNLIL